MNSISYEETYRKAFSYSRGVNVSGFSESLPNASPSTQRDKSNLDDTLSKLLVCHDYAKSNSRWSQRCEKRLCDWKSDVNPPNHCNRAM